MGVLYVKHDASQAFLPIGLSASKPPDSYNPGMENASNTPRPGLYVVHHAGWSAVGWTRREVAAFLESERHRDAKIYRIQRVSPDGLLELSGVPTSRFQMESGLFFYRNDLESAQDDFRSLQALAEQAPPPCPAILHLAQRRDAEHSAYLTALIYSAEADSDVSEWLLAHDFSGGDRVEGGISQVTTYRADPVEVLERAQLWDAAARTAQSNERSAI